MFEHPNRVFSGLVLAGCLLVPATTLHAGPAAVRTADGSDAPLLDELGAGDDLTAYAASPDGARAAAALALPGKRVASEVRIVTKDAAKPVVFRLEGNVRALLLPGTPPLAYALLHRPARKHAGDASLVQLDTSNGKIRRVAHLPASALDLDLGPDGVTILVAAHDELRTFLLPAIRSGPLFRLPGRNRAVAWVGRGRRVLVGRDDALLLLDLDDPPGRDSMPVRERIDVPSPVAALAVGGNGGLARLLDGTLLELALEPVRSRPFPGEAIAVTDVPGPVPSLPFPGGGIAVTDVPESVGDRTDLTDAAPLGSNAPPDETTLAAAARGPDSPPDPTSAAPVRQPDPTPEAEVAAAPDAASETADIPASGPGASEGSRGHAPGLAAAAVVPAAVPRPAETTDDSAEITPRSTPPAEAGSAPAAPPPATQAPEPGEASQATPSGPEERAPTSPVEPRHPEPAQPAATGASARVALAEPNIIGSILGTLPDDTTVVLLGPNNVLREAARVRPAADGRWVVDSLAPGRYRVLLDGGGNRVLLTTPPFLTVEVQAGGPTTAGTIEIIGSR